MKKFILLPLVSCSFIALTGCNKKDTSGDSKNVVDSNFLLGIAKDGVPIGEYAKKVFNHFGVDKAKMLQAGIATEYADVGAVANAVKAGSVSAGIVYDTDAFSGNLHKVDIATEEMCGKALYPVSLVKNAAGHDVAAQFFVDYLTQTSSKTVFEGVGFTMLAEARTLGEAPTGAQTVSVTAAKSMKATLTAVKDAFVQTYTNFDVKLDFRGSSACVAAIDGDPNEYDVFLSADPENMHDLAVLGVVVAVQQPHDHVPGLVRILGLAGDAVLIDGA